MLWIDQPAGVGFCYDGPGDKVTDTEDEVAEDLYHFLQSFLTANPQYIKNEFYVFGESYGTRIHMLSCRIHRRLWLCDFAHGFHHLTVPLLVLERRLYRWAFRPRGGP